METPGLPAASHAVVMSEDGRHLTESLTLQNGIKVTYSVGGCVHFSYGFFFENIPAEQESGLGRTDLAMALLQKVPVNSEWGADLKSPLLSFLQSAGQAGSSAAGEFFPCGDATCTLTQAPGTLGISYDFPL